MNIIEHITKINTFRVTRIREMLSEVCLDKKKLKVYPINRGGAVIYSASDTPKTKRDTDYRDWRFSTWVDDINASYFEYWIPIEDDNYFLEKIYFHVYRDGKEFILLHSDPNEPDKDGYGNFKYKQSPHLHISTAEQPMPHSHIALNNSNLSHCLSSIENIETAMLEGIKMINDEVLAKLE